MDDKALASRILHVRGRPIMIDSDLAAIYGTTTKYLNKQVRRNLGRFPSDFMFQLTAEEVKNLRLQFATSSWGGRRVPPLAFTEHGVAMLSSVLHSERAIQANIVIIREFVRLRHALTAGQPEDGKLIVTVINDLRGLAKPRRRRTRRRRTQVLEVTARVSKR